MNAPEALEQFQKLVGQVKIAGSKELGNFFTMIQRIYLMDTCAGERVAMAHWSLREIAEDLKEIVPSNGIMPSEKISNPNENGVGSYHVDAFLYDDAEIDDLIENKKFPRNICNKCKSVDVQPVEYVSYSSSRERASFIFQSLITKYLKGLTVVDIGSRLGAILYGAYYFSEADRIIGVEMNKELCDIQNKIVEKHNLGDRIQVINGDIMDNKNTLESANVVIMNNVFDHFLREEEQIKIWQFIRNHVKKEGTLLVTSPSLEESYNKLKIDWDVSSWVKEIHIDNALSAMYTTDHSELGSLHLYEVKKE